jgi:hypothetical protein
MTFSYLFQELSSPLIGFLFRDRFLLRDCSQQPSFATMVPGEVTLAHTWNCISLFWFILNISYLYCLLWIYSLLSATCSVFNPSKYMQFPAACTSICRLLFQGCMNLFYLGFLCPLSILLLTSTPFKILPTQCHGVSVCPLASSPINRDVTCASLLESWLENITCSFCTDLFWHLLVYIWRN